MKVTMITALRDEFDDIPKGVTEDEYNGLLCCLLTKIVKFIRHTISLQMNILFMNVEIKKKIPTNC